MKAAGIAHHDNDPGRIVIPKEIRRTLCIHLGIPLLTALTGLDGHLWSMRMLHSHMEVVFS